MPNLQRYETVRFDGHMLIIPDDTIGGTLFDFTPGRDTDGTGGAFQIVARRGPDRDQLVVRPLRLGGIGSQLNAAYRQRQRNRVKRRR